jgi:hypothetical protein
LLACLTRFWTLALEAEAQSAQRSYLTAKAIAASSTVLVLLIAMPADFSETLLVLTDLPLKLKSVP